MQRNPRSSASVSEIETLGLNQGFWTDLYHRAMTAYWPVFFGSAAALSVGLTSCLRSHFLSGVSRSPDCFHLPNEQEPQSLI